MDKADVEVSIDEMQDVLDENPGTSKITADQLDKLYKLSKEMNDECWQEIKRRREK